MRYLVFGGQSHYASGGAYDFIDGFDDLESAKACVDDCIGKWKVGHFDDGSEFAGSEIDWAHVYDTQDKVIAYEPQGCAHNGGDLVVRLHDSFELP